MPDPAANSAGPAPVTAGMVADALAPLTEPTATLAARDLACWRGGRAVLAGVSVAVAPGEVLVVTGPNGGGKSSLLRCLAGLTPLSYGDMVWGDTPALADRERHHARLAWLGHLDGLKPELSAARAMATPTRPDAPGEAARQAMGLAGVGDVPVRHLSAGQRRRLALARVLASGAPLWLLDEPTTALDSDGTARVAAALAAHARRGGLAVVASHDSLPVPEARQLRLAPDRAA